MAVVSKQPYRVMLVESDASYIDQLVLRAIQNGLVEREYVVSRAATFSKAMNATETCDMVVVCKAFGTSASEPAIVNNAGERFISFLAKSYIGQIIYVPDTDEPARTYLEDLAPYEAIAVFPKTYDGLTLMKLHIIHVLLAVRR